MVDRAWLACPDFPLPQIATSNLDIPILGQLAATNLSFGDEFEPSSMEMIGFEAAFGCGAV
jgi:hypothetical protein